MGVEFSDDCSGTFSDKWIDNSNSTNVADYSSGKLRLDLDDTLGGLYGCNATTQDSWAAAGEWTFEFDWWPLASADWYDDDFTDATCTFKIVPQTPAFDSGSWSYRKCEEGFTAGNCISLYLRSDKSGKISVGYKEDAGFRTIVIDENFTYDETNGHSVKLVVNFDDEWVELYMDDVQEGSRQTLPSDLFTDIGTPFKVNLHWHSYTKEPNEMLFDNFTFTKEDIEASSADGFGVDDAITSIGGAYIIEAPAGFGVDDLIIGQGGSQEADAADTVGMDDQVTGIGDTQVSPQPDDISVDDFVDGYLMTDDASDQFGIADNIEGGYEFNVEVADEFGVADLTDALNWSEFLRENQDKFLIKYFFTLTGDGDGEDDIEIPIQSLQARKRTGEATYLSVVIPGIEYLESINDRTNGDLVIEMAYFISGAEQLREEILRVDLENIRYDKGARNRSITLSGHRTETFAVNLVDMENPGYKYLSDGRLRYRFPEINPWLNPGDTCVVAAEGDEFRVDYITYIISDAQKFMEVSEA